MIVQPIRRVIVSVTLTVTFPLLLAHIVPLGKLRTNKTIDAHALTQSAQLCILWRPLWLRLAQPHERNAVSCSGSLKQAQNIVF